MTEPDSTNKSPEGNLLCSLSQTTQRHPWVQAWLPKCLLVPSHQVVPDEESVKPRFLSLQRHLPNSIVADSQMVLDLNTELHRRISSTRNLVSVFIGVIHGFFCRKTRTAQPEH